jgi:type II secretory pathway pseudopilin PulG
MSTRNAELQARDEPGRRHIVSVPGFTLLEMLLAAAITVVMVLFLNTVFTAISGTVSLGVATSDIIQANTVLTGQLGDDAAAMVGPTNGGFLVILQKRVSNVRLRPDDPPSSTQRADQIIWIRSTSGNPPLTPRTPGHPASYDPAATTATHARVWYGHVLRTDPSGLSASELGQPGSNSAAIHWILGRQALFLDASPQSAVHINSSAAYPNWYVTGYMPPSAPADAWYKGLSDVFDRDLAAIQAYFYGDLSNPLNPVPGVGFPTGPYRFTYGDFRLWSNPDPAGGGVETWQIAQAHAHFLSNVSDLRIDFSGDFDDVLGVDTDLISGGILWYSHFYNNPAQGQRGGLPYDGNEPITYAPVLHGPPLTLGGFASDGSLVPRAIYQVNPMPHADAAFTFVPLGIDWPQMIRFRYRVHDPRGQLADRDGLRGKLFERIIQVRR